MLHAAAIQQMAGQGALRMMEPSGKADLGAFEMSAAALIELLIFLQDELRHLRRRAI